MIPKSLREALGLQGGEPIEVEERDGRLEIAIAPTKMTLEESEYGLVAVPEEALPPLTAETVRETLERTRR